MRKRPWIAFFSQTGTELDLLATKGLIPDLIVTNRPLEEMNEDNTSEFVLSFPVKKVRQLSKKPTLTEYTDILNQYDNPIITLHGYLRILPAEVCEKWEIINSHPGDIRPESHGDLLKGKDPQKKAYDLKLETTGSVLHEVTKEVDNGRILKFLPLDIKNLEYLEIYTKLRYLSVDLWYQFLKPLLS